MEELLRIIAKSGEEEAHCYDVTYSDDVKVIRLIIDSKMNESLKSILISKYLSSKISINNIYYKLLIAEYENKKGRKRMTNEFVNLVHRCIKNDIEFSNDMESYEDDEIVIKELINSNLLQSIKYYKLKHYLNDEETVTDIYNIIEQSENP